MGKIKPFFAAILPGITAILPGITAIYIGCSLGQPNGALFDGEDKNAMTIDQSGSIIAPLVFRHPVYEADAHTKITQFQLELVDSGRTGVITLSKYPGMVPAEKIIKGVLNHSGDKLFVDAAAGWEIEEGILFATVMDTAARVQSKPSPFIVKKLTEEERSREPAWNDIMLTLQPGTLADLYGKTWDVDLILNHGPKIPEQNKFMFYSSTLFNGSVRSITIDDTNAISLTAITMDDLRIHGAWSFYDRVNYCTIKNVTIMPEVNGVLFTNCTIETLNQNAPGGIQFINCTILNYNIGPGAYDPRP
jgi:hypothetical protein